MIHAIYEQLDGINYLIRFKSLERFEVRLFEDSPHKIYVTCDADADIVDSIAKILMSQGFSNVETTALNGSHHSTILATK